MKYLLYVVMQKLLHLKVSDYFGYQNVIYNILEFSVFL